MEITNKPVFEYFLIRIERFSNVVVSIHSSWQFQGKTFLLQCKSHQAICRPLGLLNYIRIWHDNSGQGSSASWFLKYIIVRDLQTMEKFHFIAQRWFAVEKDDGKVGFYFCIRRSAMFWVRSNEF